MSNNKRLIQTILISGISVSIGYIINFLMTPYITENLGVEAYSFVSIANTFVSYAGIITITLTSFVVRYISVSIHEGKIQDAKSYYSSSVIACMLLSVSIFFIALLLTWNVDHLLKIPNDLVASVKLLFVFVFVNFVITTITTPFSTFAYIKNRLDLIGVFRVVAKILEAVILFCFFLLLVPNVWFVALGTLCASIFTLVMSIAMTHRLTPELKYDKKLISIKKIEELVKNGIWNSLNQLGNVLNSGLDLLISNLMLTGIETGQIAIGKTVGTIFSTLFQVVSQPFQPLLIKGYASGNINYFLKELSKAMKVCGFFGALSFSVFFALGESFFKLWLPSQDERVLYIVTILTVFNNITDSILRPVYYINTLTIKNKIPCWITITGGFLNVLLMYILLKYTRLGVYAVVLTTAVIMVIINLTFNPLYAARCINIKPGFFYKIMARHLSATVALSALFYGIAKFTVARNWLMLLIAALVMTILGILVYLIIMLNAHEKDSIINEIKRISEYRF